MLRTITFLSRTTADHNYVPGLTVLIFPWRASSSSFSFSINGIRWPTAFFITLADLITCGKNIFPAPKRSPTVPIPWQNKQTSSSHICIHTSSQKNKKEIMKILLSSLSKIHHLHFIIRTIRGFCCWCVLFWIYYLTPKRLGGSFLKTILHNKYIYNTYNQTE